MPPKTKSSGYVFILYNGCIKVGFAVTGYLEDGDIETHLETFKEHYGNKLKGRYVKSATPKEHYDNLNEKFNEFAEGGCVYKVNTTNMVNGLRDVSGASSVKTWNVYSGSEEDADGDASGKETEPEQKTTKKPASKKQVAEVAEEEEDEPEPPKKQVPSKKPASKKQVVEEVEEEEDEPEPPKKQVPPKKTASKKQVVEEVEEEEEEEKPVQKAPAKKQVAKK